MFIYFKNLQFKSSFNEWMNSYMESYGILYNLICMYLVLVAVILIFWLFFILINNRFKLYNSIDAILYKFAFSGRNKMLKAFFTMRAEDGQVNPLDMNDVQEFTSLEVTWSAIPLSFVSVVSGPSVGLEYSISPDISTWVTVKVMGNQWYWNYEISTSLNPCLIETKNPDLFVKSPAYKAFIRSLESGGNSQFLEELADMDYFEAKRSFDVNLVQDQPNFYRLLSSDTKMLLPINTPIKFLITSGDVLHSFAIPAGAIKVDAVPGRITEQTVIFGRPGLYYGQCSELCGPYHGFMPIVIEVVSNETFLSYILEDY